MDSFKEQLVARKSDNSVFIKKSCVLIAALFLSAILFILFRYLSFILIAMIGFGTYYLIKNFDVEYEYICTNGELDIDKIIAKSRRKRLTTVDIKGANDFGRLNDADINKEYSVIDASSGETENSYYIACKDPKFGMCYVIISPNEDILEIIKTYLPRNIRR